MRRLLSVLLSGVFLSGVLVAVDNQPASANAISLTFPSGDHRFSANEWESIATVTGTTPAVSGGTANADIRVTVQAIDNGALRLQVITDITAADSYDLNDFDGDSEGLEVISFYGKVDKVSAALASMELRRYVTGPASIEVSVNEGTGLVIGDSYYEVYTATLDWEEAAKAALSKTLPGTVVGVQCQGYLAAITSKEEQAAISSRVKTLSWLGGGDSLVLTNHAIDYIDPFDNGTQTYSGQNTATSFTSATWSQSMQLLQLMVPNETLFLAIGQTVTISGASNSNLNGTYTVSSRVTYGTDETPTNYSLQAVSITDNQQTNLDAVVSGNLELEQSKTTEGKFHWLFGPERGSQISLDNGDEQLGELLNSGDPGFPAGYPESGQTNNGFLVGRDINLV